MQVLTLVVSPAIAGSGTVQESRGECGCAEEGCIGNGHRFAHPTTCCQATPSSCLHTAGLQTTARKTVHVGISSVRRVSQIIVVLASPVCEALGVCVLSASKRNLAFKI